MYPTGCIGGTPELHEGWGLFYRYPTPILIWIIYFPITYSIMLKIPYPWPGHFEVHPEYCYIFVELNILV